MRPSRLIPLIVATALFMENTDSTVISTSLPEIARDLGEAGRTLARIPTLSPSEYDALISKDIFALKLALTAYLISLAIFIPISGWTADKFGARTVFRSAMMVFLIGSVCCSLATNQEMLVLFRFLQGVGGAMMVPVGRLVLLRNVPKNELVQALAWLTMPALVGPVIGPMLGGFITTHFGWRWIFVINIPIGIVGIILATLFIENVREENVPPLDIKGFLLSGIGLTLLMFGLATSGQHLIPTDASIASIVIGLFICVGYVVYALRITDPVIDLSLFRIPSFAISIVAGTLFRIGTGAIPFLLPLMLQRGFGYTPFQSGTITFISAAGALFMKTLASRILRRYGFRQVLTINAVIGGGFLAINGLFSMATPIWLIMTILFIGGCFRSLQFTAINAISYADISKRRMSSATSLASVMQQLSASIGISLGAFVLETYNGGILTQESDFFPAFATVALVTASSALLFMYLSNDAGAEMSGYKPNAVAETSRQSTALNQESDERTDNKPT